MSSVPTFAYGYVVGRFINSKGDSDDLDRLPDYVGANLKPTFTRVRGQYVQPLDEPEFGIHGAMVYHEPVVAGVTEHGFLTGDVDPNGQPLPDAKPGVWLVVGRYRVSLGSQFPSMSIEVLESHTEDSPLDLSTEQKYVPPPGVIVNTLPLPSGGEPGQVYGWTGSSVGWYTPEEGPSAYEVALRNGFSGTVDDWLSSLKGLKGDPGPSAYEVARSQGFSGTVDEWFESLKGLKGDAGFSAYQLAKTNGFSGTVTEWLDSLVGRKGDPGPPGSPTEYIKVGAGRPDTPATTNGIITGSEPVGCEYRSTDGAGVGAWTWQKINASSWRVSTMDSGWRVLPTVRKSDSGADNSMTARIRVTADVTFVEMTVTVTNASSWQTFAVNDSWVQDNYMTPGVSGTISRKDHFHLGTPYVWAIRSESYPRKVYIQGGSSTGLSVGTWVLSGRFPTPDTIPATLGPAD